MMLVARRDPFDKDQATSDIRRRVDGGIGGHNKAPGKGLDLPHRDHRGLADRIHCFHALFTVANCRSGLFSEAENGMTKINITRI